MAPSNIVRSNALVKLPGERVVVVGGTQGIGAGVAIRFAKAGAEVWIVGRNEKLGNEVVEQMKTTFSEFPTGLTPDFHFFPADLSRKAGMKAVSEEIKEKAGTRGVDYLIMTQGGPSAGDTTNNADGFDDHFGVQILSRFAIAYYLAHQSDTVKKAILNIGGPGHGAKSFDADDILLVKEKAKNNYGPFVAGFRDSTVLDCITLHMQALHPNLQHTHVHPGLVKTNIMSNTKQSRLIITVFNLISVFIGQSPADYAEIPLYLLANPDGREKVAKETPFLNAKLASVEPSPAAKIEETRKKVWDQLVGLLG